MKHSRLKTEIEILDKEVKLNLSMCEYQRLQGSRSPLGIGPFSWVSFAFIAGLVVERLGLRSQQLIKLLLL